MMRTIALLALLASLFALVGQNINTSTQALPVREGNAMATEMAAALASAVSACGTPGICAPGQVTFNTVILSDEALLQSDSNQLAQLTPPTAQEAQYTDLLINLSAAQASLSALQTEYARQQAGTRYNNINVLYGPAKAALAATNSSASYLLAYGAEEQSSGQAQVTQATQAAATVGQQLSSINPPSAADIPSDQSAVNAAQSTLASAQYQAGVDYQSALAAAAPYAVLSFSQQGPVCVLEYPGGGGQGMGFSPPGSGCSSFDPYAANYMNTNYAGYPFELIDGGQNPIYNMSSTAGRSIAPSLSYLGSAAYNTAAANAAKASPTYQSDLTAIQTDQTALNQATATLTAAENAYNGGTTTAIAGLTNYSVNNADASSALSVASFTDNANNAINDANSSAALAQVQAAQQTVSSMSPRISAGSQQGVTQADLTAAQNAESNAQSAVSNFQSTQVSSFNTALVTLVQQISSIEAGLQAASTAYTNNTGEAYQVYTDGQGNIAVWWSGAPGTMNSLTNGRIIAGLTSPVPAGLLNQFGSDIIAGYWTNNNVPNVTNEVGAGSFNMPVTLAQAIEANSPMPPVVNSATIVYSQSGAASGT